MIRFKLKKTLPPAQLYELYDAVGWTRGVKDRKKHARLLSSAYSNSDIVVSAWEGDILVGAIRAITDRFAHGVLYGLAVRPEFQRAGVAGELLERCISKYPNICWSAETEGPGEKLFRESGFRKSRNPHVLRGKCPV